MKASLMVNKKKTYEKKMESFKTIEIFN